MTQKEFEKIRDGLIDDSKKIQSDAQDLPPSFKKHQDKILNIFKELCKTDLDFTLTIKYHSASEDEDTYCLFANTPSADTAEVIRKRDSIGHLNNS